MTPENFGFEYMSLTHVYNAYSQKGSSSRYVNVLININLKTLIKKKYLISASRTFPFKITVIKPHLLFYGDIAALIPN